LSEQRRFASRELFGRLALFRQASRPLALRSGGENRRGVLLRLAGLRDGEKEDEADHARRNRATAR
jgi:hypothetical protein